MKQIDDWGFQEGVIINLIKCKFSVKKNGLNLEKSKLLASLHALEELTSYSIINRYNRIWRMHHV
jgi:hypothetical protein